MLKQFTILFLMLISLSVNAQDTRTYLEKVRSHYKDLTSFRVLLDYKLYRGYQGQQTVESYQSLFCGEGNKTYRQMQDVEILTNDSMTLTVNKTAQSMILSEPQKTNFEQVDFESAFRNSINYKVEVRGAHRVIHLLFGTNQISPYSKLSILVDKDYLIKKITMFYAQKVNFSKVYGEKEMDFPRLEVTYNTFSKKWKDKEGLTDFQKYLKTSNNGLITTDHYKNYELIDLRLANQK